MKIGLHVVFLLLFILPGCAKTSQQEEREMIEQAMASIDAQNYDKAISILLKLKESSKVKDLLSTAYAGRAGFNAARIADMVTTKQDPIRILYHLTNKYSIENILDSQRAISKIYDSVPNYSYNGTSINLKYATIQVYKISQILVKNYIRYDGNDKVTVPEWRPCSELQLASNDLREIIISVNRAVLATQNIENQIYTYLISLQKELNIDPEVFEETVIKNTDINNIRLSISKEYAQYMGEDNDQEFSCDSDPSI